MNGREIYNDRNRVGQFKKKSWLKRLKERTRHLFVKYVVMPAFFASMFYLTFALIGWYLAYPTIEGDLQTRLVFAEEVERVPSVMKRIAICESGNRHFDSKGNVIRGKKDKDDIGRYQINTRYHGADAKRLGLDLFDEIDNYKFAMWLYETHGTEPWYPSRKCWL